MAVVRRMWRSIRMLCWDRIMFSFQKNSSHNQCASYQKLVYLPHQACQHPGPKGQGGRKKPEIGLIRKMMLTPVRTILQPMLNDRPKNIWQTMIKQVWINSTRAISDMCFTRPFLNNLILLISDAPRYNISYWTQILMTYLAPCFVLKDVKVGMSHPFKAA